MSKPDDIPQGVWDDAMVTWNAANAASFGSAKRAVEIIAVAIMAERAACSLIATAAINRPGVDPWASGYRCAGADISKLILDRP